MWRVALGVLLIATVSCSKSADGPGALGKPAEPFGALTKLKFGMTDVELVEVVPEFKVECLSKCTAKAKIGQIEYRARLLDVSRRVSEMSATFYDVKPDALIARWGAGTRVKYDGVGSDGEIVFYSNAARTMRAWISWMTLGRGHDDKTVITTVHLRPLVPLETLIDPKRWTVAGIELLGRSIGDIRQAATAKGYDSEYDRIMVPPTELGTMETSVYLSEADGVVTRYWTYLPTDRLPDAKATILATLEKTFGKPTPAADGTDGELVYPTTGQRVTSRQTADSVAVEVGTR